MSRPSLFFEKLVKSLILQNASYWWVIFLVYHKILYDLNKITVTIRSTFWDCIFEWSFCVFLEKNLCMIHYYISSRRLALFYFSKWNSNLFSVINESDLWFVVESKTAYVTISQMSLKCQWMQISLILGIGLEIRYTGLNGSFRNEQILSR